MNDFPQPLFLLCLFCFFAYLCGSMPFGFWISQIFGGPKDIRAHGSGSSGATNVLRFSGKTAAFLTVFLDMLKTLIPLLLALRMEVPFMTFIGFFGILGHVFPVFLGFKGGKGIASALGVLLALSWPTACILLFFWVWVLWVTRYVSLASLLVAFGAPFLFAWREGILSATGIGMISLLLLWTHRENMKRLMKGKEPSLGVSHYGS
ncbi:MAG: glycerol-3-phosphate 1-O-acyltransferase PlsY [Holosporales bacterium]|nr:glycerol-3-phosphate 1-O-acyltransferase PlsY [Holosporales bacterium]